MPKGTKKFKSDPAAAIGSFSKNLMGLKFMQRVKKEVQKVAETKEDEKSFDTSLCNKLKSKQQYIINSSYQFCEKLKFGRLSFHGMNTEIEAIMLRDNPDPNAQKRSASPSESSDNEIDNLDTDEEDDNDILADV